MRFFRYGLVLALLAVLVLSVAGCSREPLAATVNGKKITVAEVDKRLEQVIGQNSEALKGAQGEQLKEQFRERVLDQMIDMELLLSEADKRNIKVSDKEVDAKIKEIMTNYNFKDQKALEEALKQQNLTMTQFKDELEKSVRIEKLGDALTKDIKISDKDIKGYYDKNKAEFFVKDQVHVAHILVQKEEDAKKISGDLKKGADFAKLAKQHSIDPGSKDNGGELPWTEKEQFVPEFSNASWALQPGQLSEPVKTTYGFHIIKLLGKKPSGQKEFTEVKSEIKTKLVAEQKREFFTKWLEDTKKKATIKKYLKPPKTEATAGQAPTAVPNSPDGQGTQQPNTQQPNTQQPNTQQPNTQQPQTNP